MALADLVVVEVVCRGNLDAAGTEFGIDIFIGQDRDNARRPRHLHLPADEFGVTFIVGTDR